MNKCELISRAADNCGMSRKQMRRALDSVLGIIGGELSVGGDVVLPDFGKFHTVSFKGRKMNLFGKKTIEVPPKEFIRFKPYSNIRIYFAKY